MSDANNTTTDVDLERTDEERLKALARKDIDPEITRLAEAHLRILQEEGSP